MTKHAKPSAATAHRKLIDITAAAEARRKMKLRWAFTPYEYDARTFELLTMLRTMRPAGSAAEREFVAQWVAPLGTEADDYGNHWLTIGDSPILWSCHTDTVHRVGGVQHVGFADGCAYVTRSDCLGADDTTGVWLMRQMIAANVPGTYVFHRDEEIGGVGSQWVLQNAMDRLARFQFAIAFDRMGYDDIITYQMDECASDEFAASLAAALYPLHYDATDGIFTDTANYLSLIPECTNISVGYHNQHTACEWLDVDFAMVLCDRLCSADFSTLRAFRDPSAVRLPWRDEAPAWGRSAAWDWPWQDEPGARALTLDDLCRRYPDVVADFLTSYGITVHDVAEYGGIK